MINVLICVSEAILEYMTVDIPCVCVCVRVCVHA